MDLSAPVWGLVASLHSQAVGLLSILQKVKVFYHEYVQLLVFTDCLLNAHNVVPN